MADTVSGPNLQLWLPCLLLAHAFAIFWLLKTQLLTKQRRNSNNYVKSSKGGKALQLQPDVELAAAGDGTQFDQAVNPPHSVDHTPSAPVPPGSEQLSPRSLCSDSSPLQACVSQHLASDIMSLEWQGIGCAYSIRRSTKVVLQDVWGRAHPGQMQALMGPSGAGKSTLMDILAMRKSQGALSGSLLVNGQPAPASFVKHTSYVPQEDTVVPTMTCQETLAFYAGVTLGGQKWNRSRRKERVQEVLAAVGLARASDTLVGGVLAGGLMLRGLSGGERRRLSIAAGILGAPSVLFLDEPTSGLDSFAALSVMGHLQHVAQVTHQTVIATIHQPRSAIWEMFDMVSLLASGRLMFHGRCADMVPWFTSLGYTYTKGSESDWVLDLVATGFDKPARMFGNTMRTHDDVDAAADAFRDRHARVVQGQTTPSSSSDRDSDSNTSSGRNFVARIICEKIPAKSEPSFTARSVASTVKGSLRQLKANLSYPTSWWRQFTSLYGRELKSMTRNPFDVAARTFTFTYVALLFGLMGYNVQLEGLDGFNSVNNMLFTTVLVMLFMPYVSISLFTADKQMYISDASARRYRASAYYCAKVLSNTPFYILVSVLFSGIFYGMCGLRPGSIHFVKFATVVTLVQMTGAQVLHLCALVAPNHDTAFSLSIVWTAVQMLCSSFFLNFSIVYMQWLTQLRYISVAYFALEALVQNEFGGRVADCSRGLEGGLVDTLQAGLASASPMQRTVLNRLKEPQPGCMFKQDALVAPLGFFRPFTVSLGILLGYLGAVHVLTFVVLLVATRNERR